MTKRDKLKQKISEGKIISFNEADTVLKEAGYIPESPGSGSSHITYRKTGKNPMKKNLEYYLNLNWSYRFEWSDEDNCYIASVAELPGCISDGKTIEEAAKMIKDALKSHISTMINHGDKINEPPRPEEYKGKILLRTTPQKHYKLVKKANAQGKSLNKFLDEIIDKEIA